MGPKKDAWTLESESAIRSLAHRHDNEYSIRRLVLEWRPAEDSNAAVEALVGDVDEMFCVWSTTGRPSWDVSLRISLIFQREIDVTRHPVNGLRIHAYDSRGTSHAMLDLFPAIPIGTFMQTLNPKTRVTRSDAFSTGLV